MPDDEKLLNGAIYTSHPIHAYILCIPKVKKKRIYTIAFAYIPRSDSDGCDDDDDMANTTIYIVHFAG